MSEQELESLLSIFPPEVAGQPMPESPPDRKPFIIMLYPTINHLLLDQEDRALASVYSVDAYHEEEAIDFFHECITINNPDNFAVEAISLYEEISKDQQSSVLEIAEELTPQYKFTEALNDLNKGET